MVETTRLSLRILLIGNDLSGQDRLAADLRAAGATVTAVATRSDALARAAADLDEAIVVDIRPDVIGLEIVRALRLGGVTRPVLFMAVRADAAARDRAEAAGACAVAATPVEALSALAALPRATPATAASIAGWRVDPAQQTVAAGSGCVPLTADEYVTFTTLAERPGVAVSRDLIETTLSVIRASRAPLRADRVVQALRRKFADAGWHNAITTQRGAGYALAPAAC